MLSILVVGCALLGSPCVETEDGAAVQSRERVAYESLKRRAGNDASSQVKLALWCEAHGLSAERIEHLALAVVRDPANSLARGLMGLVSYHGTWKRPEEIVKAVDEDPTQKRLIQEYLKRRAKFPESADGHWKLALWCEQSGLKPQAAAHAYQVIRLDPRREAAWKRLGYKKVSGHWVNPELAAIHKQQESAQKKADKQWKTSLERWRDALASRDKARRAHAEGELTNITDPRAVPMIWTTFALGKLANQKVAAELLGRIDSPGAARALAMLALFSPAAEVRQIATQTLRTRDARDFAPLLIGLLRDPIKYDVKDVKGPGAPGELVVKDKDVNVKRLYTPATPPDVPLFPMDRMSIDAFGLPVIVRPMGQASFAGPFTSAAQARFLLGLGSPALPGQIGSVLQKAGLPPAQSQKLGALVASNSNAWAQNLLFGVGAGVGQGLRAEYTVNEELVIPVGQMMLEAERSARIAQWQLEGDISAIKSYNAPIERSNQEVRQVLSDALGVNLGQETPAWRKWLVDLFGYALAAQQGPESHPTLVEEVPLSYQPQATPVVQSTVSVQLAAHSCFGAGTTVHTIQGPRKIEGLRAGDEVLTQNPRTGALYYAALTAVYHNPPNATVRIELDNDEEVVATGIHRLWKAGAGWVMARELKPGDRVRNLGGTAGIKSVRNDRTQPVFNLRVADGESFLVGESGVLAHDNSLIQPTTEPFDAVPELAESPRP
jgi:hypothetical protein